MSIVTVTQVTATLARQTSPDIRQAVIDVLRQQEALKRKLHDLLDQLGTNGRPSIG
jgi:hypothetical protein